MVYLLYLLLASSFVIGGYLMEYGVLAFLLQPAELVIICFPSLFFAVAATSWKAFGSSWGLVFGNPAKPDLELARQACKYLRVYGFSSIFMGLVSCLLGLVITMSHLDETKEMIGHMIGASLVGLIYASMLHLMCHVAEQRIKGRYLETEAGGHGG